MARGRRGQRRRSAHRDSGRASRRRPAPAARGRSLRRPLIGALAAVPIGLGLAAALVVAAGPPSSNPLIQGAEAGASAAPGGTEALPPAADDFFDGQEDNGGQQGRQGAAPDGGAPGPDAAAEGGGTVSASATPEEEPDEGEEGAESPEGEGGQSDESGGGGAAEGGTLSQPSSLAQQVVDIANEERSAAGCDALRVDPQLTAASKDHSRDMAERDYMAHESPDGESPAERAREAGYDAWSGENVASGYTSAEAAMEGWMDSPGHRDNILNCNNTEVGVGETDAAWAQNFGSA